MSKWISIKNRLPREGKEVLVYVVHTLADGTKYGEIEKDFISDAAKYFYHYYPYVTHWMPLPKPPKDE